VFEQTLQIRAITPEDVPACAQIFLSLPEWFGVEEANRSYVEGFQALPGAVAIYMEEIIGFITLTEHSSHSYEIHVIAVLEKYHRMGIGRSLIQWAEHWCRTHGVEWLHLKTRGPSTPDPGYERTRLFYLEVGFVPLFETLELWGPENAALIMVKHLACGWDV
jgi:GNAT superfamily N-acetyltransferase